MGKSLELLGLASFNVLIALMLSAAFFSHGGGKMNRLTEGAVKDFIVEVSDISAGKREDLDSYKITSYFMEHIAPDSRFKTTMRYSIPDMPADERDMELDRASFISQTLQGLKAMDGRETAVRVEFVQIGEGGKSAVATTTNMERGMMPVDDGSGTVNMMPVQGTSYCEQKIILSEKHVVQMAGATCTTDLSFTEGL